MGREIVHRMAWVCLDVCLPFRRLESGCESLVRKVHCCRRPPSGPLRVTKLAYVLRCRGPQRQRGPCPQVRHEVLHRFAITLPSRGSVTGLLRSQPLGHPVPDGETLQRFIAGLLKKFIEDPSGLRGRQRLL